MIRRNRPPKPIEPWKGPKPALPMKITYECRVHYLDLQEYLAKVYRMRDYDVLRASGGTTGCCPEYLVTGQMPPAANARQQADGIRRGRKTRNLGLIFNVLCADGFIPPGKYVLDTTAVPDPLLVYTQLLHEHQDPSHPACAEYRHKQKDANFQRRAKVLDKLTVAHRESLTKGEVSDA